MKKQVLAGLSVLLLLTGCGTTSISDDDSVLMTVGNTTYSIGYEYELLKNQSGAETSLNLIEQYILDEEVGRGKKIKKEANEQWDEYAESMDDLVSQVKDAGYKGKKDYINKVLIPSVQTEKLMKKYFKDDKKEVKKTYKPSVAKVLTCDDEKTAKKALKALKDGTDVAEVFETYNSEDASYSNEETLVSTALTDLPTRMINKLYKAKEKGVINEVFTSDDDSSDSKYYVAILVNNKYDEILDKIVDGLSSNSDVSTASLVYYLDEYGFEVHDQDIFDVLRTNNPEYLVNHPELAEEAEEDTSSTTTTY